MKRENRPINAIELHENFHKRMPKSVLEKALESLSDGNGVRCKEYGKSKIYFADQSTIPCGVITYLILTKIKILDHL